MRAGGADSGGEQAACAIGIVPSGAQAAARAGGGQQVGQGHGAVLHQAPGNEGAGLSGHGRPRQAAAAGTARIVRAVLGGQEGADRAGGLAQAAG